MIRTANQSAWQNVVLPHDVRVRIERDLAEGYVALVPKKVILLAGVYGGERARGIDPLEL